MSDLKKNILKVSMEVMVIQLGMREGNEFWSFVQL